MADVLVSGRVAHVETKKYDFTDSAGERLVRDGVDVWLIGGLLDASPTVVKCDHPDEMAEFRALDQFAWVQVLCSEKRGKFACVPGGVQATGPALVAAG